MTVRAVLLGLLGGVFVAAAGYWKDCYLRSTPLVPNHFPIVVFGTVLFIGLVVNPLLERVRRGWRLRSGELAVMVGLTLSACAIPGRGLLNYLTPCLVVPIHYNQTEPGWQETDILSYVPQNMMVDPKWAGTDVVTGFIEGMAPPGTPL